MPIISLQVAMVAVIVLVTREIPIFYYFSKAKVETLESSWQRINSEF